MHLYQGCSYTNMYVIVLTLRGLVTWSTEEEELIAFLLASVEERLIWEWEIGTVIYHLRGS